MCPLPRAMISLEDWAEMIYGGSAPSIHTLRRWAREGRIQPAPQKHGRMYFVRQDATYLDSRRLVSAVRAGRQPGLGSLIAKLTVGSVR